MAAMVIHGYMAQCYDCFHYSVSRGMCNLKKEERKAWADPCKDFQDW